MKKRILAALIAFAAALTAAGCGAGDKSGNNGSSGSKSEKSDSTSSEELRVNLDNLDDAPILPNSSTDVSFGDSITDVSSGDSSTDASSGYGSTGTADGAVYTEDETGKRVVQGIGTDGVFDANLFTFEYDSSKWSLNTENSMIVTTAYLVNDIGSASLSIIADSIDTATRNVPTLEESHENIMSNLENMGCEDIKEQELTIGGEKALLTQAKNVLEEDIALRFAYVECIHNDLHIVMQLIGTGTDYDDYEKSFEEMVNSLKFTD